MTKTTKIILITISTLLLASIYLNVKSYQEGSIVLSASPDEAYEAKIDSLEIENNYLKQSEAEVITRWRTKNEIKTQYIVFADDSLQPGIRSKLLSRAQVRLSR